MFTYDDLLVAYMSCRRNKRQTTNALKFEIEYETKLRTLLDEINSHRYRPHRSITFIVNYPVKREIFAADFRDRIVHHLVINKINHLLESRLINDCYACRASKGTLLGIRRVENFIRKCSRNFTQDCFILKLDIEGFFMHIDKNILWRDLTTFLKPRLHDKNQPLLLDLCRKIIFNDPTKNCVIKGSPDDWLGLPKSKSMFYADKNHGLPIGNLTSQVLANFYMSKFDHFVKHELKLRYYGRYVDDFIIIHENKQYLRSLVPHIRQFLSQELNLKLHPKKLYLQHYSKGVTFLGVMIKPKRTYPTRLLKAHFYDAIERQNKLIRKRSPHKPTEEELAHFLSSMNSYLGIMSHHQSYRMRKNIVYKYLSGYWWNYVVLKADATKFYPRIKKIKNRHDLY